MGANMPRGTGSFRLKPVHDVRGRLIYRNNAIALALMLVPCGAFLCGGGGFVLWITTCDDWRTGATFRDLFALVFGLSSFLYGLLLATFGLRSLFGRQQLVLDPVERQATFRYRRLRRNEHHCTYDDLLLRLHALEFGDKWRGFALAFHIAAKRFVVLQTAHRANAEEIAAETQELTGIAWEHSEEPISVCSYGLA